MQNVKKYIRIDLTNNCNLRCIMCQEYSSIKKSDIKFISDSCIHNIRSFHGIGDNVTIQIGHQAEPLLHTSFSEILHTIRTEFPHADIIILTNGLLLHNHINSINTYASRVFISFDSLNIKTYENIRIGSNYKSVLNNIKKIDNNKIKIAILQTVMAENFDDIQRLRKFCKDRGYDHYLKPMSLRSVRGIIHEKLIDQNIFFHKDLYKEFVNFKDSQNVTLQDCMLHVTDLYINHDGECSICRGIPIGSLAIDTLPSILCDEKHTKLISDRNFLLENYCSKCELFYKCTYNDVLNIKSYFSEDILGCIDIDVKNKISVNSGLSDFKRKKIFINSINKIYDICNIFRSSNNYYIYSIENEFYVLGKTIAESYRKYFLHLSQFNELEKSENISFDKKLQNDMQMTLAIEGYKQFNIIQYSNNYYGVLQSYGELSAFDLTANHFFYFKSDNIENIYKQINQCSKYKIFIYKVIYKLNKLLYRIKKHI